MTIETPHSLNDTLSCAAYRRVLDDLVADEVDAGSLVRAEAHLALCGDCRFALAQARVYRRMMRRVGQGMRAPNSLRDRVQNLLRKSRGPQP